MVVHLLNNKQKIYWMRCLAKKEKNIDPTKKYVGDQNVDWWGIFHRHHHTNLDNHLAGYWPLQYPFTWNIGVGVSVSMSRHQSFENTELDSLVRPRQRDIWVGLRISHTAKSR